MRIFKYDLTDSTSTRAREYMMGESPELPALFIAEGQTAGRGRRGRGFHSARGKGLYMTLLFRPDGACDSVYLTVRAAVALSRAIKSLSGLTPGIKWVNDIFVGSKKLAGILAEGEILPSGELAYAAVGVGVNLLAQDFPPELSDIVTTLEDFTGKRILPEALAEAFVSEFLSDLSAEAVLAEYRRLSVVIGREVLVRRISGEEFSASVIDITDSGALLVRRTDGSLEELISAEVSIRNN